MIASAAWVCVLGAATAAGQIQLRDVTGQTGFRHTDGSSGRRYIVETVSAGLALFDFDRDGDIDVYFLNGAPLPGTQAGRPPRNALYRNDGDGTFTDVSNAAGIAARPGWGMGMVCADYDDDGDTDVFVANDVSENFLFNNDGTGKFEEAGLLAGVAFDLGGNAQGSMGVDCGDYDHDGRLDFYLTSYQQQFTALYQNLGDGFFEDVKLLNGAAAGIRPYVTWGNGFADFDNDADRDVFVACGHLQDNVHLFDDTTSYHARNILLMNSGDGQFVNVSNRCGDGLAVKLSSRGAAFERQRGTGYFVCFFDSLPCLVVACQ